MRIWPARLYLTVDGTVEPIDWLSFKVKVKRVAQGSICSLDTCEYWVMAGNSEKEKAKKPVH